MPSPHQVRHVPAPASALTWPVRLLPPHPVTDPPDCRDCGGALDLHQPDPERPRRLLGVCTACGAWHLIGRLALVRESPAAAATAPPT